MGLTAGPGGAAVYAPLPPGPRMIALALPGSTWAFLWMLAAAQIAEALEEEEGEAWKQVEPQLGEGAERSVPARLLYALKVAAQRGAALRLKDELAALDQFSTVLTKRLGYELTAHDRGAMESWVFDVLLKRKD